MKDKIKVISLTLITVILLGVVSMAGFIYSGIYNISAISYHFPLEVKLITFLKNNSVRKRAENFKISTNLNQESLIKQGFNLYKSQCYGCHGAPGDSGSRIIRGLNPTPTPLEKAKRQWSNQEIAWIIANGFKMTGMPGFKLHLNKNEITALTAFVVRINTLSPMTYKMMEASVDVDNGDVQWTAPEQGWSRLSIFTNTTKAKEILKVNGCIGCHEISGIRGPKGNVGPSLMNWKDQHYIAGKLVNNPINLVEWIRFPQKVESHTSMPNLDLSEEEAWEVASYLYSQ